MIEPQREMTFAEVRLQSQRIERFHLCLLLPWLCRLIEMVNITDRGREPRVRESEVRIEFDRLLVKIYRRLEILQQVVRSRLILPPTQIEHVGVRVSCRFRFDALFFLRRKRCL